MSSEDAFKLLPKELTELILSELEPADLARSSGVNHLWRKLASNDLLWRKFFNDYQNEKEPLKIVYGNRKVNWMKQNYKLSIMQHPHGTFYIAKTFSNSNILYTGCLADVMEEWDMEKAEKIREYEVPTGPASNYRMDETYCLIERENSLKRWKRHKGSDSEGSNETFDWIYVNPHDDEARIKYFQAYQFVRERCVMATVKNDGTLVVQLHDMDKNQCVWRHELKVAEAANNAQNNPDEYQAHLPRLEWDSLCMSYDTAVVVYQNHVIVLDLNKHDVKYHMRDDDAVQEGEPRESFTVCAMHKDLLLASKRDKTYFYSLKDGELVFTVTLDKKGSERVPLYRAPSMGWARMDGEKAIVCDSSTAFLVDVQKQVLIGTLEWSDVSRGWTQDIAMNEDFFAVLATNEVVLFDFRKRSKEQELKDAEELKQLQAEYARLLEEEKELQAKRAEEEERNWQKYREEHPEEFGTPVNDDFYGVLAENIHSDSSSDSESSEEQPIIPPPSDSANNNTNEDEEDENDRSFSQGRLPRRSNRVPYRGRPRGNRGRTNGNWARTEYNRANPKRPEDSWGQTDNGRAQTEDTWPVTDDSWAVPDSNWGQTDSWAVPDSNDTWPKANSDDWPEVREHSILSEGQGRGSWGSADIEYREEPRLGDQEQKEWNDGDEQ